jgi:F-type H+-transporting ATPase subunit b
MLDIHFNWLLILIANFLVLIYILNIILYKPLLKVFQERKDIVKNSLDASNEMNAKKEQGIAAMNQEISAARAKAKEAFETKRNEGLEMQRSFFSEAEERASEMLQKAREELRVEVEKARRNLKADVEKFSDEIVRKLVSA